MSICLNQMLLRRTLGSPAAISQCIYKVATSSIASSINQQQHQPGIISSSSIAMATTNNSLLIRNFAAAAKTKQSTSDNKNTSQQLSYQARKDLEKQKRTERYNAQQSRLQQLKARRDNSPKDVLKTKFRTWYDNELKYHNVLLQRAKKEKKPWRIRVAVMVERIPIVTPDIPEWEREYNDLRDYIWTYGKEYPEETGFMYAMDKPEDHIVPSDEEMIAALPFTPAPRETEADATGNIQTRDRQLKTSVFLGIKTSAEGNKSGPRWTLPSAITTNDETLLQTAQRAVEEVAGKELGLWCPSNAPMTVNFRVYNKNLPEDVRGNYYGEKIFYYRVQHDNGDVNEQTLKKGGVEDWGWLAKEEMVERVTEERGEHQAKFFHYML